MKQFHCLALLAAGVASSPIEILNYEAAEAGHGQVMSGTPGEAVMGEFYWKAPEGDAIKLVYTADETGYHPTSPYLPLSPKLTPEVMEARAIFMDKFAEAQDRAEEDMAVVADVLSLRESDTDDMADEDIDMAVVAESEGGTRDGKNGFGRKRRDADADAQVLLTQPRHYAPNYPYYFVNNLVPTVKKDDEVEDVKMLLDDETAKRVDDAKMNVRTRQQYYLPMYAPSYYYPSLVQYPANTVTRTVGPWIPVQYPLSYPGLLEKLPPQPYNPPEVANERILPSETQAGEDVSAALLL